MKNTLKALLVLAFAIASLAPPAFADEKEDLQFAFFVMEFDDEAQKARTGLIEAAHEHEIAKANWQKASDAVTAEKTKAFKLATLKTAVEEAEKANVALTEESVGMTADALKAAKGKIGDLAKVVNPLNDKLTETDQQLTAATKIRNQAFNRYKEVAKMKVQLLSEKGRKKLKADLKGTQTCLSEKDKLYHPNRCEQE